jgi:hypothetical protein
MLEGRMLDMKRRILALVLPTLVAGIVVIPGTAQAHCPGGSTNLYVSGGQDVNVRSARTKIGWMSSSNVCNSGASYSVSIVNYAASTGWLQVGWRYYNGYSSPKGYCERMPQNDGTGSYALTEYNVDPTQQRYSYFFNDSNQFECRIGSETLRVTHEDWLGFSQGEWVPVQAEAHAPHVQLGRVAPDWLTFSDAEKIPPAGGGWSNMQVDNVNSDAAVWNWQQPDPNGFKVNTDASH